MSKRQAASSLRVSIVNGSKNDGWPVNGNNNKKLYDGSISSSFSLLNKRRIRCAMR
ncbi:MAG: hypothetical protein HQK53_05055 [Oligoflexia bacterium]|nr:hypothetical protein [Oligoflexia bacterium]